MEYRQLNDGNLIPMLGFGTYKIDNDKDAEKSVLDALEVGYRLIDTATFYLNENGVGNAIKSCGLKRDGLFITTKIWPTIQTKEDTIKTIEDSLRFLKVDYIDMVLIHWPSPKSSTVFETMCEYKQKGLIKSVGVSNFKEHHIEEIINDVGIVPCLDQVELHPYFQQPFLKNYLDNKGIAIQAWSPLMRAKLFDDVVLQLVSKKHNKSVAQIILRYDLQKGILTIPKSTHIERIKENFDIFDFSLDEDDIKLIGSIDKNLRQFRDPDCHGFCAQ